MIRTISTEVTRGLLELAQVRGGSPSEHEPSMACSGGSEDTRPREEER